MRFSPRTDKWILFSISPFHYINAFTFIEWMMDIHESDILISRASFSKFVLRYYRVTSFSKLVNLSLIRFLKLDDKLNGGLTAQLAQRDEWRIGWREFACNSKTDCTDTSHRRHRRISVPRASIKRVSNIHS